MMDERLPLDPRFLSSLAAVPTDAWAGWFGEGRATGPAPRLVVAFALPATAGLAALCVLESGDAETMGSLYQTALRRWNGAAPADAQVLHVETDGRGGVAWTLASAWADPFLRNWLRDALATGGSLRAMGWEWQVTPERSISAAADGGESRLLAGRRHDVVLFPPGAVGIVYRRLTRGAQPEFDLLRHLERVSGRRVAPALLASAVLRAPDGQRTASAILEELDPAASTVRSVIVNRLRRALEGDPSLQAVALDDVRAVGVKTCELHADLGRPFDHGVLRGAVPATVADVDAWVARTWTVLDAALRALRDSDEASVAPMLSTLPGKLQQFAAAAEGAPGLAHRIHGSLGLDNILIAPPRQLSVVEFDGDPALPEAERHAAQSPWRDVAHLLVSIAEAAAEAATLAGGDAKALEIAWLWEREARKACLEGYGSGAGAMHALLAIFEMEYASRQLLAALTGGRGDIRVPVHTLTRLTRTVP
jgi:maltose alpha-D-glucosyltransferase / alpha-amylase